MLSSDVAFGEEQFAHTVIVRHAPQVGGTVEGSLQSIVAENVSLVGGARITGDCVVPGTPTVTVGASAWLGGVVEGTGDPLPAGRTVILSGTARVGLLRTRAAAITLPVVLPPAAPVGTRAVALSAAASDPGDFATLRDLTLTGAVGQIAVPAGNYGSFSAASGTGFTLGVPGATQPSVYAFQQLALTGTAKLQIVGPVVVTLGAGMTLAGGTGVATRPEWLRLNFSTGGLALAPAGSFYGYVTAPAGAVDLASNSRLTGGVMSDQLTIAAGATLKVMVPNRPPLVTMEAPVNQAVFLSPTAFTLQAKASDPDGTVTKVEFYTGRTKLGQATVPPYRYEWTTAPVGTQLLTARATDDRGWVTTSESLTVRVNGPPRVTLTAPTDGAVVTAPVTMVLRASASDSGGVVAKVEFFSGATKLGEATKAPYQWVQTGVGVGSYTFTAKATDDWGASTTSAPVRVTVRPPPGVALTAPVNGAVVAAQSAVTLEASAADVGGAVVKVEFFDGRTKLGESTLAPYRFTWPAVPAGTRTLTAKVTNALNASTVSAPVTLISNPPPTVALTVPRAGGVFTVGTPIVVKATASDAGGAVAKVEFFSGTVKLGEAAVAPFQMTWLGAPAGVHVLTARASDNYGATTTSATIPVTVNTPPAVTLTSPLAATVVTAPATVTLQAAATDGDGTVAKVEFFRNRTKLGEAGVAPFAFSWTNVAAGAYTLTAKATDNRGAATTSAPVTLLVNAPPRIALTAPATGAVVTAPANITLRAAASDAGGTVAKVEFFNGTTKLGEAAMAPFQLLWPGVAAGSYALTARATDNYGAITNSAAVALTVNAPPSVALSAPLGGTTVIAPTNVTLQATAVDADGTVAKVEFYRGTTKLGTATAAPWQFTWSNVPVGSHVLTAKATDNRGAAVVSAPVTLVVNALPTVALTSPVNGAVATAPAMLTLKATAADSGGSVARVEFFSGGTKLGESAKAPFQTVWSAVSAGAYVLTARATDNLGAATISPAVNVTVNAPPAVALTVPAGGTVLTAPGTVTLQAAATDADGTVAKVEFFRGTTKLGESTTAPYQTAWNNIAAGTYSLTARATDNRGAAATSAPVALAVNAPPTVRLTTPVNNAKFTTPASITLAAAAADANGTIAKVEFFEGTNKLGEAVAAPYQFFWIGVTAGTYVLTARATDQQGATTTSTSVTIQVAGTGAPSAVALVSPPANAVVTAGTALTLTASATNAGATINKVEFFQGTTKLGDGVPVAGQANHYVLVLATGLTPGTYVLTVRVTDSRGVVATSAGSALIANAPPVIALIAPTAGAVLIAGSPVALTAEASDIDGTVAKVEFFSGTTKLGEATAAPWSFTVNDLAPGSYGFTARATDNRGAVSTAVQVMAMVDAPPAVALTAPAADTVLAPGSTLALEAAASDSDGAVAKVEFYSGTTKLGEATAAPYRVAWTAIPAGTYALTAKATDNLGVATTSAAVTLIVDAAPAVALTAPLPNAVFAAPGAIRLAATASDSDGTVAKVEFFHGTTKVGEASAAPYEFNWEAVPAGRYTLTAVATDDDGVSAGSTPVAIHVSEPPVNRVTVAGGGIALGAPARVTLLVNTAGSMAAIDRVEVYRGGVLVGLATRSGTGGEAFEFTEVTGLAPGVYVYRTRVHDGLGLVSESEPMAVTVLASLPYLADFEAAQGYAPGSLDGQLGWAVGPGSAMIGAAEFFNGARSVALVAGAPVAQVTQAFAEVSAAPPIGFADFYARPVADADLAAAAAFEVESARLAFRIGSGGQGVLYAFDGDGQGGGEWVESRFAVPLGAGNRTQAWVRLTARLDFGRQTWDLYAGGAMVLADLGFREAGRSQLTLFGLQGHATGTATFDYFYAGPENPLFADTNANGIEDAWELARGLSLANANRDLSPAENGVTVVAAYAAGTDPNDYYNGRSPTLSVVSGDQQTGRVNEFNPSPLSVVVLGADGQTALANAPVIFVVTQGGGGLAASSGGSAVATAASLTVRTGPDGVARIYYRQPATAGIVSRITAGAGGAQVAFITTSAAAGVRAIAAGANVSVAVKHDGSVWTWGGNAEGQAGRAAGPDSPLPTAVSGLAGFSSAAAGAAHGLAVTADGVVWAWGRNVEGQLGRGIASASELPAPVSGLPLVAAVAAGAAHSLALGRDGTVWAWGDGAAGALGGGTAAGSFTPVPVAGLTGVVAIAAGTLHSVAVKQDGTVWTWGSNADGQLGQGGATESRVPVMVTGIGGISAVAAGDSHTLAVTSGGAVWAWGLNEAGQLGDGTTLMRRAPVAVQGVSGVMAVAAGGFHSLALTGARTVWAWGANARGQLQDPTLRDRSSPALMPGVTQITAIAGGGFHSLLLREDGQIISCGDDSAGQLGGNGVGAGEGNFVVPTPTNMRPTVTLTAPASGAVIGVGATIVLAAEASDADGSVARVDFMRGSLLIGQATQAPFTYAWTGAEAGNYGVQAVAFDDRGASAETESVTITVQAGVVVPIDQDGNGLADEWELRYFGQTGVDPTGDPDGDGVTNRQEFLLGRNPTKGAAPDVSGAVNLRLYRPRP